MRIGIIGNGFVGKATKILECAKVQIRDICACDIIFISVPTPMNNNGSCYLKILESIITDISNLTDLNDTLVVIRSTVPPGTSEKLN